MSQQFSLLDVQESPVGGLVVRFKLRKLILEEHLDRAREELESLVAPERLILIDMTQLEYMSSAALTVLINTQRALRGVAGNLTLCGLSPKVENVFRICRLHQYFEVYPDLESALGAGSPDA